MSRRTRSPLKDKPLRNPGQSVDEKLFDVVYDRLVAPSLLASIMVLLAVLEWWRYYKAMPPSPLVFSVAAVLVLAYAAFRVWGALPEVRSLKLARNGERSVGQFLDVLRERGYRVYHDVVGSGFNVDHVIIGPTGVYTVETKTYSKPVSRDAKIEFDGETLRADGLEPDRDPVVQAKAQASWLRELLAESTGQKYRVRPIIVFPGWYIAQTKGSTRDVWVLNPKALPEFLDREAQTLSESDIKLASYHLSRFIRTIPEP